MTPLDIDAIIAKDMPAIRRYNELRGIIDPEVIINANFPDSVHALYLDLVDKNQRTFKAGRQQMLRYAEYLSLLAHASAKREMGGSYHIHPHSVAKRIVQKGNEPYYTVIAALTHDIIEEGKYKNREVMGRISQLIGGLRFFAINRSWEQQYANSVCHDMVKVGVVLDRLTRREGEDYFLYIKRLFSPKVRLGPMRKFGTRKSSVQSSIDEIIRSTLVVKLCDRINNTQNMEPTSGKEKAYPLPKQLYEIYKNMVLLSYAKKNIYTRQLVADNVHYNDLIDASLAQLRKIAGNLEAANPSLKKNSQFYRQAMDAYDAAGGFKRATMYREIRLPRKNSPEVMGIAEMIDGIMSRYAGFVHEMVEHPREISMTPERLYVDCLDFMVILQKLRDDPKYAPDFMFSRRKAGVFIRSLPQETRQ